ncbi:fibronectin type III domain-containing protein [Clostridium algoriphilum]|uniref:fibronectin type III domain-containing protein n=1 Tax=Clostridium algoriphilum TaxID=198347 RepID=UPI001CF49E8C|nr:fibronectin type III domain-containing protein [Clostridium algoriphilum]MCB2293579.1 fibronectin type III domain-containing protein [Clostridium algoriphilum]
MVGTVKVYSYLSSIASSKPVPSSPTKVKAIRASSKSIKLTWSTASGANGYEVFKSTSINGTYNLLWRTESLYCTNSRLTAGRTYYYKVRSYRTVGNTRVYSDKWSAVVYAKA